MKELLERARELLDEYDDVAIHAVTIDYNTDISALASIVTGGLIGRADLSQLIAGTKSAMELVFYLGYLAGKEEGNLKLWEDQL